MPDLERDNALRELGRMAAERREEANLTIEDVYERTRIRLEFLRGIEEGNYDGFPEPIYIKGFIRTYLKTVGGADLQEDFMAQLKRVQPHRPEPAPNFLGSSGFPKGFKPVSHFWLFLVLLAALLGTGGYVWYAWSSGDLSLKNLLSDPFWRFAQNASVDERGREASLDVLSVDALSLDVASMEAAPVSAAPVKAEKPAPQPKPSLAIRAKADVWMRVTIGEELVFSQTLKRGNVVSWDLPVQARVVYGRPNAAEVILNGRELGPANPKGSKKSETYLYLPDGTVRKSGGK